MATLPFERIETTGADALREWERLRASDRGWPVIVGTEDDLLNIADQFSIDDPKVAGAPSPGSTPRTPAAILDAAGKLRPPASIGVWEGGYGPGELQAPVGDWPKQVAPTGLTIATDILTGKPHDRVHILLVSTRSSWEAPAYLRWGGWNACPPPEHHVATLRYWHERFGAELVGISGDTMNVRVSRRPASRTEALALAREQYRYCPDIVDQGVETLNALAATLMAEDYWYFWWD